MEDMLTFLKRLPDNSCSFLCSGMEILDNDEYKDEVNKEIKRALNPDGAYIGNNYGGHLYPEQSGDPEENLSNAIVEEFKYDDYNSITVYRKK